MHCDEFLTTPRGRAEVQDKDRPFLAAAVQEAYEGVRSGEGGPFGAIIVRGEEVSSLSNPLLSDPTLLWRFRFRLRMCMHSLNVK